MPQGLVLSPLLYPLFIDACVPVHGADIIIKFADDTAVLGLIRGDVETADRDEVQHLFAWGADNNLALNTQKTKEIIVHFRQARSHIHAPIYIKEAVVECVSSFKFLDIHISDDLTWTLNSSISRVPLQPAESLAPLCATILVDFHCCTIESILTNCVV